MCHEKNFTCTPMNSSNFSHDGIHDTFTNLAAPNYFYEELSRLIARYERSQTQFRILNITFVGIKNGHESEILEMAALLRSVLRGEDLAARLGAYEFGLLINGSDYESLMQRIEENWFHSVGSKIHLSFKIGEPENGTSALLLLNKMDE
jgi:GGDEF domain-containing protein